MTSDKRRHLTERNIFDAYDRMREIESKAIFKSKAARRANQRRINHTQVEKPVLPKEPQPQTSIDSGIPRAPDAKEPEILPFDEMDDLS